MRLVSTTATCAQCMSSERSAVRGLNWNPSQQIMNFEQYNCELISILLHKADNSHNTSSPANLSELRTHAEYKPLNCALIFVRWTKMYILKMIILPPYIFLIRSVTPAYRETPGVGLILSEARFVSVLSCLRQDLTLFQNVQIRSGGRTACKSTGIVGLIP